MNELIKNQYNTTGLKVGYWEQESYDDTGNIWCGHYDNKGLMVGTWNTKLPDGTIRNKMVNDDNGKTKYIIDWFANHCYYVNSVYDDIHSEEYE